MDAASRKFIGWYTTLAWSLCSRRSSAGPAESSNRRQNGHMKSMNRSTRTGPAPTLIPSPSLVAPAGMTLGAAGPVIGLSSEGNPGLWTVIRLTSAGMSGHPSDCLICAGRATVSRASGPRLAGHRTRPDPPRKTAVSRHRSNADSSPQGGAPLYLDGPSPDDAPPRKRAVVSRPPGCATPAQSPRRPGPLTASSTGIRLGRCPVPGTAAAGRQVRRRRAAAGPRKTPAAQRENCGHRPSLKGVRNGL